MKFFFKRHTNLAYPYLLPILLCSIDDGSLGAINKRHISTINYLLSSIHYLYIYIIQFWVFVPKYQDTCPGNRNPITCTISVSIRVYQFPIEMQSPSVMD